MSKAQSGLYPNKAPPVARVPILPASFPAAPTIRPGPIIHKNRLNLFIEIDEEFMGAALPEACIVNNYFKLTVNITSPWAVEIITRKCLEVVAP